MGKSWYKKSMPEIKIILPLIANAKATLMSEPSVKDVLIWGSVAKNYKDPTFIIRDVDIIAVTNLYSEDLISITADSKNNPFKMSDNELEDEGFDPKTIKFTKKYLSIEGLNFDKWTISIDKKLLHWGAIPDNKEDSISLKIEAENYANSMTQINREKLKKYNQSKKEEWTKHYDNFMKKIYADSPLGWFESNCNINEVLMETIKIEAD
jgi:hypothetical protein